MATRFLRPVGAAGAAWAGAAGAAAAWAGGTGAGPAPACAKPANTASTTKHNTAFLILASDKKFGGTELPVPRRLTPGATVVNPKPLSMWKNEPAPRSFRKPMKRLRVGILFGGRSGEHEISLLSAASVFNAIDKNKYEVVPIGITKEGRWVTAADAERLLHGKAEEGKHLRAGDPEATPGAAVLARGESVVVPPEPQRHASIAPFQTDSSSHALTRRAADRAIDVDVIFPVLHGTFGE